MRGRRGRTVLWLLALASAGSTEGAAQVTATLTGVNVPATPGTWPQASSFTLVTLNTAGVDLTATFVGRLMFRGQQVGSVPSDLDFILPGTTTHTHATLARWNELALTGAVAAAVAATGRLPAGPYEFCMDLTWTIPGGGPRTFSTQACTTFVVQGPQVSASLTAAGVPPQVSEWATRPGLFTLITSSNAGSALPVNVSGRLRKDGAQVGVVPSDIQQLPAGTATFTSQQVARWGDLSLTGAVAAAVAATGRLPGGGYELCLDIASADSPAAFANVTSCASFVIQVASVQATLAVANVPAAPAAWATTPSAFTLVTTSNVGAAVSVGVGVRLRKDGQDVGVAPSDITSLPDGVRTFQSGEVGRWSDLSLSGPVAAQVTATGRLPIGSYELCVDVASTTSVPVFAPVTACAAFQVQLSGSVTATLAAPVAVQNPNDWSQLPSSLQLIVTNSTGGDVDAQLELRLSRDGTPVGSVPGSISVLPATAATTWTAPQIAAWQEMALSADVAGVLSATGRLPDGSYRLCAAFSSLSVFGAALPDIETCAAWTLSFPAPPRLIAPADQTVLTMRFPVLQWTPVVGQGATGVGYQVRVVEVLEGQSAVQALAANPPLVEQVMMGVTALLYPVAAQPLEDGKRYAWRVQAVRNGQPFGLNSGLSEVFGFEFETPAVTLRASGPATGGSQPDPGHPSQVSKFYNASLRGHLDYTFEPGDLPAPTRIQVSAPAALPKKYGLGQAPPPSEVPASSAPILAELANQLARNERHPLAGVPVRLRVRYRTATRYVATGEVSVGAVRYDDADAIVASGVTNTNGDFFFLFHDDDPTGVLAEGKTVQFGYGDLASFETNATLVRYYTLEVGDPHYLNPSDELVLDADRTGDAGTLVSLVRSYQTTVKLIRLGSNGPPSDLRVQLLRERRPTAVPAEEGVGPTPRPSWTPSGVLVQSGSRASYAVLGEASSANRGEVTFTRLVRNVGPNDHYYVRVWSDPSMPYAYRPILQRYARSWPLVIGSSKAYDDAYFNEQYRLLSDTLTLVTIPEAPSYVGTILRAGTTTPVGKAAVFLRQNGQHVQARFLAASDSGRFVFKDLRPGSGYAVGVYAAGFQADTFPVPAIADGQRVEHTHLMKPDGLVRGRVADETGQPTFARVRVDDGVEVQTHALFGAASGDTQALYVPGLIQGPGGSPSARQIEAVETALATLPASAARRGFPPQPAAQLLVAELPVVSGWEFELPASSGQRRLIVDAGPKYFVDTLAITVPAGASDLGVVTVKRRLHRLRVRVLDAAASTLNRACAGTPVVGARLTLEVAGAPSTTSDPEGWAEFAWEAPGNDVGVRIEGPDGGDWLYQVPQYSVPAAREFAERCAYLKRGARIEGTVWADSAESAPVPGARVFVVGSGPSFDVLQDTTDASGRFQIRGVPSGGVLVRAGKAGSQLIGDSVVVATESGKAAAADFHLTAYAGIDLSTLLGFPLEVHTLVPASNGVRISGALLASGSDPVFASEDAHIALPFDSVLVRSSAAGGSAPVAGRVLLSRAALDLRLYGDADFLARQARAGGLLVRDRGDGVGALEGAVELLPTSFSAVSDAELRFVDAQGQPVPVHLLRGDATGAQAATLQTLTAGGQGAGGEAEFRVGRSDGGALPLRLFGFTADTDPTASSLRNDGARLTTTVHTQIPGAGDLALRLPSLRVVPGPGNGVVYPLTGEQTVEMALQGWRLQADAWSVSSGKLLLAKGAVVAPLVPGQASSVTTFPFLGMGVTPTTLQGGTFGRGPVLLSGIVPLGFAENLSFGRESVQGPWTLLGEGGVVAGLPGFGAEGKLTLNASVFRSSGTHSLSLDSDQTVRLFETADYTVGAMGFNEASVGFAGGLDLKVPALSAAGADVYYTLEQGEPVFHLTPVDFEPADVSGAKLRLTKGTLAPDGFRAEAQVYVPGKFSVKSEFLRAPRSGSDRIEATPAADATFDVGEIRARDLGGGARVENGAWVVDWTGTLALGTELEGDLSVSVQGGNVLAGTGGFGVRGVSTPLGDVQLFINFEEQRYEGSLEFSGAIATGLSAQGTAELQFSGRPGARYWYVFSGANFTLNSPHVEGTAAFITGDVVLPPALLQKASAYLTKPIPSSFHDIDGFYLNGRVTVPVPICPSGSFDIGVAKVAVWCDVWGDLRLGMNWQNATTLFVGSATGADVGVSAKFGLGLCVSVWGQALYELGAQGSYRSDGAWYVQGGTSLDLRGGASYGVGVDDFCLDKSKSFTIGLGADAQLGYNWDTDTGSYFRIYYR